MKKTMVQIVVRDATTKKVKCDTHYVMAVTYTGAWREVTEMYPEGTAFLNGYMTRNTNYFTTGN